MYAFSPYHIALHINVLGRYHEYMNPSVSLLDPVLYTAQRTYWRSPFLFTVGESLQRIQSVAGLISATHSLWNCIKILP